MDNKTSPNQILVFLVAPKSEHDWFMDQASQSLQSPIQNFSHGKKSPWDGHRQPPAMAWKQIAWSYELSSSKKLLSANRGVHLQDSVTWAGFLWPLFAIENPLDFQWPCDLIKTETDFILDEILTLWSLTQNSHENPHLLSLLPCGIFFVWIFHGVSSLSTWSLGF